MGRPQPEGALEQVRSHRWTLATLDISLSGRNGVEGRNGLDVLLYTAGGRYIGLLARVRDLLPGTYSFGLTGRSTLFYNPLAAVPMQ